jgi:hypothetical protein
MISISLAVQKVSCSKIRAGLNVSPMRYAHNTTTASKRFVSAYKIPAPAAPIHNSRPYLAKHPMHAAL